MKELPVFKARKYDQVLVLITQVLTHPNKPDHSYIVHLDENTQGYYRAIFSLEYFTIAEATPTKSQWNSLKKKLKRHDRNVFVFKETGLVACESENLDAVCCYIDFGFFAH